jgi:UDP-N-acetylglucosamine 2-epimerase (non-hydrolysing)
MIFVVVGTRPEVIKLGPVVAALHRRGLPTRVVATGQHHDHRMMGCFLDRFQLEVAHRLALGSRDLLGSFVEITSRLGELFAAERPALVLAVGDTTSVIAAGFAARKTGCGFGHVEAGLRAFSRELPEEEHRICADALADLLFAPTRIAMENLAREHVNGHAVLCGNPVLDALRAHAPAPVPDAERRSILVTIHRQETVDDPDKLRAVLAALDRISRDHEVEWPMHPRTRAKLVDACLPVSPLVEVGEPRPYDELLARLARARVVVTDSGGIQEEAAILGTPCVTVRRHTERPETIEAGVGRLAGIETAEILDAIADVLASWRSYARPVPHLYGDGHAGDRIADVCADWLADRDADHQPALRLAR